MTLVVVLVMVAIAGARGRGAPGTAPDRFGNYAVGASAVAFATFLTAILALTTAIRPQPWYDARYAIPLAGIILGNVLNGGQPGARLRSGGVVRERAAIEAQLALGAGFSQAMRGLIRASVRRAPAADHQPDVGRRRSDAARHHDRPDPRRAWTRWRQPNTRSC